MVIKIELDDFVFVIKGLYKTTISERTGFCPSYDYQYK